MRSFTLISVFTQIHSCTTDNNTLLFFAIEVRSPFAVRIFFTSIFSRSFYGYAGELFTSKVCVSDTIFWLRTLVIPLAKFNNTLLVFTHEMRQ
jgi:hypothetical protein